MNNRTYSTPKGQTVKNDSAVTQAAKTETNVKYVGLQKPNDVDIELENRLQEIEMKTEELINLYNGGINVSTAGQTSVVNEYGADRETDTDENEAVSNVKVYNRKLYRGNKLDTESESAPIVSRNMIKMRPTLPYYFKYETTATETGGGTGRMRLDFNSYMYPVKLSHDSKKYCQAMIVGAGRIDVNDVYDLSKLTFPFPNLFATPRSGRIDPDDPDYDPITAWHTASISISYYYNNTFPGNWVMLYNELGYETTVDLGPHFDQVAYSPDGYFTFPQSTHLLTSKIHGYVEFTFIIQGHIAESNFNSYEWEHCTVADDREDPMGWWDD